MVAGLLAGLSLTLVASVASAGEGDEYTTADEKDGYSVKFIDDLLQDSATNGTGPMIVVSPRAIRVTWMRPRTAFVNEMYKSVEGI